MTQLFITAQKDKCSVTARLRHEGALILNAFENRLRAGLVWHTIRAGLSNVHCMQEAPPHWRSHHKANVKIVIELKCIECIEKQR